LWEATEQSLNTPFYGVADQIGPNKVLQFAYQAGIRHIWSPNKDGNEVRTDLDQLDASDPYWKSFSPELAIGQYKVTVLDHANGVATFAGRGRAATAHFVQSVSKAGRVFYQEALKGRPIAVDGTQFSSQMADDAAWAMQKVMEPSSMAQDRLAGGRPAAAKTGTWQLDNDPRHRNDNAHAYMVGFTAPDAAKQKPGLATAVWVGNKGKEQAIRYFPKGSRTLSPIFGSNMPGPIWKNVMDAALKGAPVTKFPDPKFTGRNDNIGNANPPDKKSDVLCIIPQLCPSGTPGPTRPADGNGNGNGNGNGDGGGGGGGGNGQDCTIFDTCPAPTPTRRR
jgi:membrane peptidoglycan carboxypeptidase